MSDDHVRTEVLDRTRKPGWWLCIVGEGLFARHALPATGEVVVGRTDDANITIDDSSVSRRHLVLRVGERLEIEDLGSANGTRIGTRVLTAGIPEALTGGEVLEIGSVMAVVQWGQSIERPRRIWSHHAFEARLEGECARAGRGGAGFSLVRLLVDSSHASRVGQILASLVRASDMVASYATGEFEVMLVDTLRADAQRWLQQTTSKLTGAGCPARTGLASFPEDGLAAEQLIAVAGRGIRPSSSEVVVVHDGAMQRLHDVVARVAAGTISVLLLGETGVGKEIFAETIHRLSPRSKKPMLALNCAALSETLLESELFGHAKGAFTGALRAKDGLLASAAGGTVFLDEVGELPMATQVKLLRVIEQRQVTPVGALKAIDIDVRFVAATNRNLEEEIARGTFRQDLYFRLNGFTLVIPPLRDRPSEIEPLARSFLTQTNNQSGREMRLSDEAIAQLQTYTWPGNIRELRNVIERAVLLCPGDLIAPEHLPLEKMKAIVATPAEMEPVSPSDASLPAAIESVERQQIIAALARCHGNQSRAAKLLGISRSTLLSRLDAYGLPRPRKT